ncbi:MAG: hypothetical protein ACREQ5_07590 [Candidatus Dormibacteria bacterium]
MTEIVDKVDCWEYVDPANLKFAPNPNLEKFGWDVPPWGSTYENPWLYQGIPYESQYIDNYYGFVYEITLLTTGASYIGRKYFYTQLKKKNRRVRKEGDWKKYYGSSKVLHALLEQQGKLLFRREILSLHTTKSEVNFEETRIQFALAVLDTRDAQGKRLYINENIAGKYFGAKDECSKEHREKLANYFSKVLWWNDGEKEKRSVTKPGPNWIAGRFPRTQETKDKISQTIQGWDTETKKLRAAKISIETQEKCANGVFVANHASKGVGLVWWTDGKHETRAKTCPGANWTPGRLLVHDK